MYDDGSDRIAKTVWVCECMSVLWCRRLLGPIYLFIESSASAGTRTLSAHQRKRNATSYRLNARLDIAIRKHSVGMGICMGMRVRRSDEAEIWRMSIYDCNVGQLFKKQCQTNQNKGSDNSHRKDRYCIRVILHKCPREKGRFKSSRAK